MGIQTLADALQGIGVEVSLRAPRVHLPVYTLERLLYNEDLRWERAEPCDATVGFDMDGYRAAGRRGPHLASL